MLPSNSRIEAPLKLFRRKLEAVFYRAKWISIPTIGIYDKVIGVSHSPEIALKLWCV
jgi:hypothetical protein